MSLEELEEEIKKNNLNIPIEIILKIKNELIKQNIMVDEEEVLYLYILCIEENPSQEPTLQDIIREKKEMDDLEKIFDNYPKRAEEKAKQLGFESSKEMIIYKAVCAGRIKPGFNYSLEELQKIIEDNKLTELLNDVKSGTLFEKIHKMLLWNMNSITTSIIVFELLLKRLKEAVEIYDYEKAKEYHEKLDTLKKDIYASVQALDYLITLAIGLKKEDQDQLLGFFNEIVNNNFPKGI